MNLKTKLARLGITGNLYQVYLATMEQKEATISELAQRTSLPRTTTYDAVTKLEDFGLITITGPQRRRKVRANNPGILLEQLAAKRQLLKDLMPELQSMHNRLTGKPQIRFYEGEKGIVNVLWDSLRCRSGTLHATFAMKELQEVPGIEKINEYRDARIEQGIKMQVIRSAEKDTMDIWPTNSEELRELRFAPSSYNIAMTTLIYDNNVALISSKTENYGLIIESEEFATFQRSLFESLWTISQPDNHFDRTEPDK